MVYKAIDKIVPAARHKSGSDFDGNWPYLTGGFLKRKFPHVKFSRILVVLAAIEKRAHAMKFRFRSNLSSMK